MLNYAHGTFSPEHSAVIVFFSFSFSFSFFCSLFATRDSRIFFFCFFATRPRCTFSAYSHAAAAVRTRKQPMAVLCIHVSTRVPRCVSPGNTYGPCCSRPSYRRRPLCRRLKGVWKCASAAFVCMGCVWCAVWKVMYEVWSECKVQSGWVARLYSAPCVPCKMCVCDDKRSARSMSDGVVEK